MKLLQNVFLMPGSFAIGFGPIRLAFHLAFCIFPPAAAPFLASSSSSQAATIPAGISFAPSLAWLCVLALVVGPGSNFPFHLVLLQFYAPPPFVAPPFSRFTRLHYILLRIS